MTTHRTWIFAAAIAVGTAVLLSASPSEANWNGSGGGYAYRGGGGGYAYRGGGYYQGGAWHSGWVGGPRVGATVAPGLYAAPPIVYAPPPVVYAPPPVVYYAPPPVVYYAPP